jgi:hypothetical protein
VSFRQTAAGKLVALLKCGNGMPSFRLEKLEHLRLPVSTQWEIVGEATRW